MFIFYLDLFQLIVLVYENTNKINIILTTFFIKSHNFYHPKCNKIYKLVTSDPSF